MAAADPDHQVESSGGELSTPPRSDPEPGSPSAQIVHDSALRRSQAGGANTSSPSHAAAAGAPHVVLGAQVGDVQPEKPARRKPGRKPGYKVPKDPNAAESSATDGPRKRGPRKTKDPNAPPVPRRKRKLPSLDAPDAAADAEGASMQVITGPPRADIQPRPSADFKPPPTDFTQRGNNADINARSVYSPII